ncbi:PucR family transcriptional regulator [Laceyella putida]|uniref:PucR family transcriptional regulator n=1 Tax=Laceyella putida TaxID=110101 RepID=A0ABW2RGA4_9BACL
MNPWNREQERVKQVERIIGAKAKRVEPSQREPDGPVFQLPSGKKITFDVVLSEREHALVQCLLRGEAAHAVKRGKTLQDWIKAVLEGENPLPLSEHFSHLHPSDRIPALLLFEQGSSFFVKEDLSALFDTYFSEQKPWLIELNEREWLVFAPLREWIGADVFTFEAEELLLQAANGLQGALADEFGLKTNMVLTTPISSWEQLPGMWKRLVQVREVVCSFRTEQAIWVTWKPRLERLLMQLDRKAITAFLEEIPGLTILKEAEMQKTIDMFLRLDLNVSETARHLFLHRNTLLYRFDRVKQETGLDVRRFADAMLIKVILLMLKHHETRR